MFADLFVAFVVVTADGVLDGAIHPFHLPTCPRMVRFGEPLLDAMSSADAVERMTAEPGSQSQPVFRQVGELDAVVGEHCVDRYGTAAMSASRNPEAAAMSAWSSS